MRPHEGWEGKRYTSEPEARGTYEAIVYSNVGAGTPGEKFSVEYSSALVNGALNEATTEGAPSRVASPRFDQSAGTKSFALQGSADAVTISGSYHRVDGV